MNTPQALSTVYAVAAAELQVTEPLDSLIFKCPIPFNRRHLVAATTSVTGLDVTPALDKGINDEAVLQECGLVLAEAVKEYEPTPADVQKVFLKKFQSLVSVYSDLSGAPVVGFRNSLSVADAIASELAIMDQWIYTRNNQRS